MGGESRPSQARTDQHSDRLCCTGAVTPTVEHRRFQRDKRSKEVKAKHAIWHSHKEDRFREQANDEVRALELELDALRNGACSRRARIDSKSPDRLSGDPDAGVASQERPQVRVIDSRGGGEGANG